MIIIDLSRNVIKRYIAVTSPQKITSSSHTVNGTVVTEGDVLYVQIDGSNILTPVSSTIDLKDGDRVLVLLQNHEATVIGSPTSPTARLEELRALETGVSEFEVILADKVGVGELVAMQATIEELEAKDVEISGKLTANEAKIETLEAENATINGKLDVYQADIEELQADTAKIDTIEAQNVEITEHLDAVSGKIDNFESAYADIEYVMADNVDIKNRLTAAEADIVEINTSMLTAESADIRYANIDFSNIGDAAIETFFSKSGMIEDLVVSEGTITGNLVGVTIKGDLIEGGTVIADKLVVQGEDGLYYKLNTDGMTTEAEQTEYNSLDGSVITAKSITATKISVDDLVAFGATIGGFKITDSSLYSGVKESVDNTTTGVYMDDSGQMAIGDGLNFLKYYYDAADDKYKLEISADNITMGSRSLSISKTVSGDVVHIEDAAPDSKLLSVDFEGRYEQFTATGKNLLSRTLTSDSVSKNGLTYTLQADGGIHVSGTATFQTVVALDDIWNNANGIIEGELILSDGVDSASVFLNCTICNSDTSTIRSYSCGAGEKTMNMDGGSGYYVTILVLNGATVDEILYPMIRLASITDNTWEPYTSGIASPNPDYPQEVETITEAAVEVRGKNLFPSTNEAVSTNATAWGGTLAQDGEWIQVTSSGTTTGVNFVGPFTFEAGVTYAVSVDVKASTSCSLNYNYIMNTGSGNVSITENSEDLAITTSEKRLSFTFSVSTEYTGGFMIGTGDRASGDILWVKNLQIERASTVTDYSPYTPIATTLDLQGNEICELPDGTKDKLTISSAGNVTLVKNVQKVVLDGTESWAHYTSNTVGFTVYGAVLPYDHAFSSNSMCEQGMISDHFISTASCWGISTVGVMSTSNYSYPANAKRIYINPPSDTVTTADEWKTWLTSNPVTVYYKLAESQTISLGKIDMPKLPEEIDNIWIDANLKTPLKVKYLTEAGSAVSDAIGVADAAQYTADTAQSDIDIVASNLATLQVNVDSINATVSSVEKVTTDRLDGLDEDITTLTNKVSATITSEDVQLQIDSSLTNHSVGSVKTSTGFTFDADGLTISKSSSDMTTNIDEDGMTVYRNDEAVLIADNEGVKAEDLYATTFLIVGGRSRFENYTRDSEARTGCFWIG